MPTFNIPTDIDSIINTGVEHMEEILEACMDAGYQFGHYKSVQKIPQSLKNRLANIYQDPNELSIFLHAYSMQITWGSKTYYRATEKNVPILTIADLISDATDFSDIDGML